MLGDAYETCERCQGTGYAPFIRAWGLYRYPCKPCDGSGRATQDQPEDLAPAAPRTRII